MHSLRCFSSPTSWCPLVLDMVLVHYKDLRRKNTARVPKVFAWHSGHEFAVAPERPHLVQRLASPSARGALAIDKPRLLKLFIHDCAFGSKRSTRKHDRFCHPVRTFRRSRKPSGSPSGTKVRQVEGGWFRLESALSHSIVLPTEGLVQRATFQRLEGALRVAALDVDSSRLHSFENMEFFDNDFLVLIRWKRNRECSRKRIGGRGSQH